MRNWKKILSICLGISLTFNSAAFAEIIIPPIPFEPGAGNQQNHVAWPGMGEPSMPGGNQTPGNTGNPGNPSNPSNSGVSDEGPGSSAGTGDAGQNIPNNQNTPTNQNSQNNQPVPTAIQEPVIAGEGAVLMDAATGKVLYGKNQDKQFYPASITKIMTALVVLERSKLSDVVTFSSSATTNLESGAVSLGITEGDKLTVEQALHGLLLKSANEIGNGLAEHVGGSVSGFADLMNAKAKALGCKNTHFANPHGLNNSSHKTTPYDMALIMRAALQDENFRKIDTTLTYAFPATKKSGARTITMGHKMMYSSDSRYYEGIIGGKTGYTSLAGNTLVTGAERNGVRLIAVVMKSKSTQYTDTKALLDYGFANYSALTSESGPSGGAGPAVGGSQNPAPESKPASGAASDGWMQDAQGWYYIKADKTRATGEWQTIGGREYWFDSNAYMAVGWRQFSNGDWYYFKESSGMAKSCWIEDQGDWFYIGADGVLLMNTTTPDGYPVNADGIWVQ